ncbi:hypothetical protein BMR07_08600 [Methylococcaceae bacterium CS1]|nr:hypothetical protein BMR07_08600 [Methylococcaceae bacterium CS1]
MTRPGFKADTLLGFYANRQVDDRHSLKTCPSGKIYFQHVTQLDISASFIRQMIAEQKNVSFLLPESVIKYIQAEKIYRA